MADGAYLPALCAGDIRACSGAPRRGIAFAPGSLAGLARGGQPMLCTAFPRACFFSPPMMVSGQKFPMPEGISACGKAEPAWRTESIMRAWHFAEKTWFFRLVWSGRRCAVGVGPAWANYSSAARRGGDRRAWRGSSDAAWTLVPRGGTAGGRTPCAVRRQGDR